MKTAHLVFVMLGPMVAWAQAQSRVNALAATETGAAWRMGDGGGWSQFDGADRNGSCFGLQGRGAAGQDSTLCQFDLPIQAGTASSLPGGHDNAIEYATPALRGLSASAIYRIDEAQFSNAGNRAFGATFGYAHGPATLSLTHQRKKNFLTAGGSAPAIEDEASNTMLATNLQLGRASAFVAYGRAKGAGKAPWNGANPYRALVLSTGATDSRDVQVGVALPFGAATFMASAMRRNDRTVADRDATQIAIGVTYSPSRRTDFYTAYGQVKKRNGGAATVTHGPGPSDSAFKLGMRHSF